MSAVGVVGASARAACHSLARAGFASWAVDLFTDRDLARVAPCSSCPQSDYPTHLPTLAAAFPPGPLLYTGGLENHPRIVAALATRHELWGNGPDVLEQVRNPWRLLPALTTAGFASPVVIPACESCPTTGRWLRKPIRSGAGIGIRFANPGEATSPAHYFQEFIDGTPMSALFVSDPDEPEWPHRTCLLGITQQLVGSPHLHASPFAYCGNIGPVELARSTNAALWLAGLRLSEAVRLRGLWGLDFILKDDTAYAVEINPRYTASVEVLEHGAQFSALWSHAQVFTRTRGLAKLKTPHRYSTPVGKGIYYAPHPITFPIEGPWDADLAGEFDPKILPDYADIPAPGAVIPGGHPVLSLFVSGNSAAECLERVQSRAAELDLLFPDTTP
jgi:predicted ATP-grasp superfamily ATP-dependent carboligase